MLRGTNQSKQWCEPASPLQPSSWLAQATQPDTDGEQHLEGARCVGRRLPITLTVSSKIIALLQAPAAMPVFIKLPNTFHCTIGMLLVTPWGKRTQFWRTNCKHCSSKLWQCIRIGSKNKLQYTHVSHLVVHYANMSSICTVRHKTVHEVCQAYSYGTTLKPNYTMGLCALP